MTDGVWGYAGYDWSEVHRCINGKTTCYDLKDQRRRTLRATLLHWNPDHEKTCPRCKTLLESGYDEECMKADDARPKLKAQKAEV